QQLLEVFDAGVAEHLIAEPRRQLACAGRELLTYVLKIIACRLGCRRVLLFLGGIPERHRQAEVRRAFATARQLYGRQDFVASKVDYAHVGLLPVQVEELITKHLDWLESNAA